jgi:hypothetical protein
VKRRSVLTYLQHETQSKFQPIYTKSRYFQLRESNESSNQLTPQQYQTNTQKLAKNVHAIANKKSLIWSQIEFKDDNPKSENVKNHLKRDQKNRFKPQEKKQF